MDQDEIKYFGHTSVMIKTEGLRFFFDPNFSLRHIVLQRLDAPVLDTNDLHQTHCVLFSNAHRHRLDLNALRYFRQTTQIVLPLGLGRIIGRFYRFHVTELKDKAETTIGPCKIIALQARHHGFRNMPWRHRNSLHYIFKMRDWTIFYGSDTRYDGSFFHDIGQEYKIDLAILPVDHLNADLLSGKRYLNVEQALQAFKDLQAIKMIPNAFGSFNYQGRTHDKIRESFDAELIKQGLKNEVCLLKPGESLSFSALFD